MDKTIPIGFFLPNLLCLVTYTSGRKHCCELFFQASPALVWWRGASSNCVRRPELPSHSTSQRMFCHGR